MPFDENRRVQAVNAFNDGVKLAKGDGVTQDLKMAFRMMSAAVDIDPGLKEGWFGIGNAVGDMNMLGAAVACMRRTVELDPQNLKAWVNLGHRLYHLGRHSEARHATERALEIDPENQFALTNLSLIESVAGNNKKALSLAKRAWEAEQKNPTGDPAVEMQMAFAHLYASEWIEGLKWFNVRFRYKLHDHLHHPYPEWQGEQGGTLVVFADQGMGDAICYSRFIPEAAARVEKLICVVQPEIVKLYRTLLQDAVNIDIVPLPAPYPYADYWTSLTSLPVPLGLTNKQFEDAPWLRVPGFKLPTSWKVPDRRLHIGICWAGNPQNDVDRWRSIPFEHFLGLYRVPGIQLYSLQVGSEAQQLELAGARPLVRDLAPHIREVTDTLAIMRELDLVIVIESAVAWMAAQLGMECWVPYSWNGGDYRFGRSRVHPLWTSKTRVFKQGQDARWEPVFDRIVEALRERVDERANQSAAS